MPIHVKPDYETFNHLQVRAVNKIGMYCVAIGGLKELSIDDQEYMPQGDVYLYQELVEDDDYEKRMRDLYDKMLAEGAKDIPPYEELSEFDGLIILKAKYHLGKGEHSDRAILVDDVEPIAPEDQLTFDDDGNIVKASIFDEQ